VVRVWQRRLRVKRAALTALEAKRPQYRQCTGSITRQPGPDWQGLETPQDDIVLERRVVRQQVYVGKALEDGLKGNTPFQPGQRRPQAVVDATAKGDMAGFLTGDIELLRVAKHVRIVIGRADQYDNALAFLDVAAFDLHILHGGPAIDLHWPVVAYHLLHRGWHAAGVVTQRLQLVWVAQQRQQAIANEVRRGLVAGNQEESQHDEQFALGELVAGFFGSHERADQVVARFLPPRVDDVQEVGVELAGGLDGNLDLAGGNRGLQQA